MKRYKLWVLVSLVLCAGITQAHEGHDHDGPVSVQAPKGGLIKSLEETYVEVVPKGTNLKIYLYDKDLKPRDAKLYQVLAKAQKPRSKKQEDMNLVVTEHHFETNYDAQGAHRYTLVLSVKDPKTQHTDTIHFTIEPKQ